ncbi:MAG: hypothetical protein WBN30_09860 [Polyangiales bacterium]
MRHSKDIFKSYGEHGPPKNSLPPSQQDLHSGAALVDRIAARDELQFQS